MSAPNVDPAVLAKVAALRAAVAQALADAGGDRVAASVLLIQRGVIPSGVGEP